MSKFSLSVLQRRVFPFVGSDDPDIVLGATFGEDAALTRIGDEILASHVDPIVGAIGDIGRLAVHVACNDIATAGIAPRWLLLLVLVPRIEDEELLEQIMRDAAGAAREVGAGIIGGHTGYSAGLTRPLVAVTALGTASGRKPVLTGGAEIGDLVLVTKGIALEGTAILAQDFADVAREKGLSEKDLAEGRAVMAAVSVVPEALALSEQGVTAMHDVTRGGLLEALLEIAHLSKVGIEVDGNRLPIPPVVTRFAEAFPFDPLRMISSGTLAVTVPPDRADGASRALKRLGTPSAYVGRVVEGQGVRLVRDGTAARFTEIRCEEDELARLWALHPRSG
ncbi:MAG: AIR synthase family protein [Candidatus Aminicenantes bacterium]|nr:AIR synthase family protein [Candidatus Aminicenantes bacterium]